MQVMVDALINGDFYYNDNGLKNKLKKVRSSVVPNIAFKSLAKYYNKQLEEKYA